MHLVSFAVILILLHSVSVARAKNIANEIEDLYSGMLTAPFFFRQKRCLSRLEDSLIHVLTLRYESTLRWSGCR